MDSCIQISKLNDFIFCPYSLYFHSIYDNFAKRTYQRTPQIVGTIKHETIDEKRYANCKKYLVGAEVYSEKYNLIGKIDIYDKENRILIERKTKIKDIFDGYKYQLYGQMFCLQEMGYEVRGIHIYSMVDNKKYVIDLPNEEEKRKFENVISAIENFNATKTNGSVNGNKCINCIYSELCYFKN